MGILAKLLFLLGAGPTVIGIGVLVALEHRPESLHDHLKGIARYLIAFGMLLMSAHVLMGWTPGLPEVILALGLGLAMGMYAREVNLIALAQERIEQVSRDAGA